MAGIVRRQGVATDAATFMIRFAVAVVVISLLVLLLPFWMSAPGRFLVTEDPLVASDAVLPLAGDERRIGFAADLYRGGYAEHLIVTRLPLEKEAAREAYLRRVLESVSSAGVPFEAISIVPAIGRTTHGEAVNVRTFMERANLHSLIVVTNPWHTRRSSLVFRDAFRGSDIEVRIRSIERGYRPDAWWKRAEDRRNTLSEYVKLLAHVAGIR